MWPFRWNTWFPFLKTEFREAAAAAEVFFTAYFNLFVQAGIKAGETLLFTAGAAGLGPAAIQLCSSTWGNGHHHRRLGKTK